MNTIEQAKQVVELLKDGQAGDCSPIGNRYAAIETINALIAELTSIKGQEPVAVVDGDAHSIRARLLLDGMDLKPDTKLYLAAGAQPSETEAKDVCKLCGSDSPFTGSCGGGRNNPKALCYEAAPVQAGAQVNFEEQPDGSVIPVDPSEMQAQERKPLTDEVVRLANVALHEMPRPSTDWHEAAKRVCQAVSAHGIKEQP